MASITQIIKDVKQPYGVLLILMNLIKFSFLIMRY